jgi:hypothetical protein
MRYRPFAPLTALLLAAGCGVEVGAGGPLVTEIDSPAAPGSGEPHLAAGEDGTVHLSWLEPAGEGGHALRFATLEGERWSEPRTIAAGADWFVNWADFPSIVSLGGGRMAAHWLRRSGPSTYAYDVVVAVTRDGGATWTPGVAPHGDGTQTEHGFVSMWAGEDGTLELVWLDGRNTAGTDHDGHDGHDAGTMTLRHGRMGADGRPLEEVELDGRVCDCCQTGAALTSTGPVVVYRGRTADEVRDILVTRRVDGRWTPGLPVHADGWVIPACPVNGPQVDARAERVAVAWYTAAGDTARVLVAFSDDAGERFAAPVRVDEGEPLGRVDVVILDDGDALVSWMERSGERGAEIRVRRVSHDRGTGPSRVVGTSTGTRSSGFPRMAASGGGVVLAWTVPGHPALVRTARLDPSALERAR